MWLNGPAFVLDMSAASNQKALKSISSNFIEYNIPVPYTEKDIFGGC